MSELLKDTEFAKYWNDEKNRDIDLDIITVGSNRKVWWLCEKGHEYEQIVQRRVKGRECPYCANRKLLVGFNDFSTTNPALLEEWDYKKNSSISPTSILSNYKEPIHWICKEGHEWNATINSRLKGSVCPICSGKELLCGYNDFATVHPDLLPEWNYEKNDIEPDQVIDGSHIKVWWRCPNCNNDYEASISNRTRGRVTGCPYCAGKRVIVGFNDAETWCKNNNRLDLINEYDTEKNDFAMNSITIGSGKKIWWRCHNGHSYSGTLDKRIKLGTGCGICSHKVFKSGINDLTTTNPEIVKYWDYDKNSVDPSEVMAGSNKTKYWFKCSQGHSYQQTLLNKKKGYGCPVCSMERHVSFPEKAIFYYMKKIFKDVSENYRSKIIGRKEIDVFVHDFRFGIEYDGEAWHKDSKRDLKKDAICEKNGITLIRIRENGCTKYESSSVKKYVKARDIKDLDDAIKFIIRFINTQYGLSTNIRIDCEKDRISIMEMMGLNEKRNSIAKRCPEILKFWDYKRNGDLLPEQVSFASIKRVYFICPKGHEWESCAHDFMSSPGCSVCSGRRTMKGVNDLFTTNPELISQWSKANTIDPTSVRSGSNHIALWKCDKCGYEYDMMIQNKVRGGQCPYCNNRRIMFGFNDLCTTNPEIATEWDYEKNEKLTPEQVFKNSNKKVWWICGNCHSSYERSIAKRTLGQGCPFCSNHQLKKGFNDLKARYPELALEWDVGKNINLNPEDVFPSSNKSVWWKCSTCGHEWKQLIVTRVRSGRCPNCKGKRKKGNDE